MSALRQALDDYLALRHAMGCTWQVAHTLLPQFLPVLERQGAEVITTAWALCWATQPRHVQPAEGARRLRVVRGFAQSHSALDPRTEIPPPAWLPARYQRRSPSLSSEAELTQLLQAARQLASPIGLRAHTYATVFGLLAGTGRRLSALVALDTARVALRDGLLTIGQTQFRKSRLLPLHPTTQQALPRYRDRRDRIYPIPTSPSFFVSEQGTRLTTCPVRATFVQLSRQIGLRGPRASHGPRLHDFRHRCALQTLGRWYQKDVDVERHRPALSTSLGHVKGSDTSWYLSASPELLSWATERLEPAQRRLPA